MQNKLSPEQGILLALYSNFISFRANAQEFNTSDVIAIPLQGNMTSHNLINNNTVYKCIEAQYISITEDLENFAKSQYGDQRNIPMLETTDQVKKLYERLQTENHHLIGKIETLNSLLEDNKKQTDKLYAFVVDAKSKHDGKEFTTEEDFKNFLKSNSSDLAKLGSTKELMQISNAFIKIHPEPKDFNGFIDKLDHINPGKKNVIIEFIEKIIDKLFSVSQAEKIGKNLLKDINKAIEQSSDIQKKNQNPSMQM